MPQLEEAGDDPPPTAARKASGAKHVTPQRRNVSGKQAGTPTSAPARGATKAKKGAEATLLGDFLLGRPSPNRTPNRPRRKTSEALPAQMKVAAVSKIQSPGGVKDRVKQWQKATVIVPGAVDTAVSDEEEDDEDDEIVVVVEENTEEQTPTKARKMKSEPGKAAKDHPPLAKAAAKAAARPAKPKAAAEVAAPKKRVVSDDHWMQRKKKSPPRKAPPAFKTLPENFVKVNTAIPPLSKKISNWASNVETPKQPDFRSKPPKDDDASLRNPRVSKTPTQDNDDIPKISAETESQGDDRSSQDPGQEQSLDEEVVTERRSSGKRRGPGHVRQTRRNPKSEEEKSTEMKGEATEGSFSYSTTSDDETSVSGGRHSAKLRGRKGSLEDIPVGYSAFSVLDMPVGGKARTMARQRPKRNSSFNVVPKVFKKVYAEAQKIVSETVEPPRIGVNQPTSIESWLNGTSDPFIDDALQVPGSTEEPSKTKTKRPSFEPGGTAESLFTAEYKDETPKYEETVKNEKSKDLDSLPTMQASSSPFNLKRRPANRLSPGQSPRRIPLKERLAEAFHGQSSVKTPLVYKPDSEYSDTKEDKPPHLDMGLGDGFQRRPDSADRDRRIPSLSKEEPGSYSRAENPVRRTQPTLGRNRLSTIASVDTFRSSELTSTNSEATSLTGTSSELSQTTLTHDTLRNSRSGNRRSDIRSSNGPAEVATKPPMKRHLTKHSDLLSVLSLPDVPGASRSGSIRSARSVRTTRSRLDAATIPDLLHELADDETKYMRELRTLVDGVIPVLLSNALKSSSTIGGDSLNPGTMRTSDSSTKPIVDMGISLERLKSLHKRIPLQDPDRLVSWAFQAHKTYEAYLASWRMGFQDVVVNLAPASTTSSEERTLLGVPRSADCDLINGDGERVDVAFLLKRPLVRIKHLAKITKGFCNLQSSDETQRLSDLYQELLDNVRRRTKEEQARQEDMQANNTDVTRVRSLLSLGPIDSVVIDRTRQVNAKDYFALDLQHSNGQRIGCRVEILLRDKPKDPSDPGDVLICEVDATNRWLLFPPITLTCISACRGDSEGQVIVMVRKRMNDGLEEQHEFFTLTSDDMDAASEWIQLLGEDRGIPAAKQIRGPGNPNYNGNLQLVKAGISTDDIDIPIGEPSVLGKSFHAHENQGIAKPVASMDHVTDDISWRNRKSSRYEMSGGLGVKEEPKSPRPSRYHQYSEPAPKQIPMDLHSSLPERPLKEPSSNSDRPAINRSRYHSRTASAPVQESSFSKELPKSNITDTNSTVKEDTPPPPPAHRTPVTASMKDTLNVPKSPAYKVRRKISSPLKHEYQPSDASATSESSDSEESDRSSTDFSDEEGLEAADLSSPLPGFNGYGKKIPSSASIASLGSDSLAPSNSASQAPYRGVPKQAEIDAVKLVASISCWNDKGRWDPLYDGDCSIVVKPGMIEAFVMSASHSAAKLGMPPQSFNSDTGEVRPLVALDLTPLVPLRQSNALDIEIRSPPLTISLLKCTGTIRFRARTVEDCRKLYAAIHHARLENPVYKRLEQERVVNSYGNQSYDKAVNGKRRNWLGRQKSYRASARAPSVSTSDNRSSGSFDSAISALKRLGNSGNFNIAKSSVIVGNDGTVRSASTSLYTSSSGSSYTGITPPRSPNSESIAQSSMSKIMARGTRDIKIRLYKLETMSDWGHLGSCRLTIENPPPGMRQASTLYSGIEKRITVVSKSAESKNESNEAPNSQNRRVSWGGMLGSKKDTEDEEKAVVLLDVVVGSYCVKKQGLTGIVINVWEELVGDNGEVGMVGANGGLSGRTRKWLFQFATKDEASWIYVVLGGR